MNKNIFHNQKHLTLTERTYIEQELVQGSSFSSIASTLHKDPSTISKEVKRARVLEDAGYTGKCHNCMNYGDCFRKSICGDWCRWRCRSCYKKNPTHICKDYMPWDCNQLNKPPYVCNACTNYKWCPLPKGLYVANKAQASYEKKWTDSRKGINMTPEELSELNDLISPLVLKGQPPSHIFAVHKDEIPVCRRTLYNYFDQCVFKARNIDLPRRVHYKKRKNSSKPRKKDYQQTYRNKRTYLDFERFIEAHPDVDVVEMDTVKGSRQKGKCLLTLLFRSCNFMIIILLPDCTQRTYVFYCDPYVSNQKARLEKNPEYIRYIIPKGRSMYKYTQEDINLMASHINSTARDSLNGATPFDLADLLLDKKIPLLTGQHKVSPDNVVLKPVLLEHREN